MPKICQNHGMRPKLVSGNLDKRLSGGREIDPPVTTHVTHITQSLLNYLVVPNCTDWGRETFLEKTKVGLELSANKLSQNQVKSITDNYHRTPSLDRVELVTGIYAHVRDGKLADPFSQNELFQRLYDSDPLPRTRPDGSVRAPVCSLRFGVRQGLKLRPCED